jgi:hypothetical protein
MVEGILKVAVWETKSIYQDLMVLRG